MKKLALEYLVAAYGSDKLNDPSKAEPIVQKMIELEPERADQLLRARQDLRGRRPLRRGRTGPDQGREVKPNDPTVYTTHVRLLQPPGRLPQDDRSAQEGRGARARTIPRATTASRPTTGRRPRRTTA